MAEARAEVEEGGRGDDQVSGGNRQVQVRDCEMVPRHQLGKYSNAHELFSTVTTVDGNSLLIPSATRVHIGRYYCIASNGIPPTVSKIISLKVQCKYKLSIIQCG